MEEKIKDFIKEYKDLIDKYGIDFAYYPVFSPTENGSFNIRIETRPVEIKQQSFIENADTKA